MGQPTPGSWARGRSGEGLCGEVSAPIAPIQWRPVGMEAVVTSSAFGEARLGRTWAVSAVGEHLTPQVQPAVFPGSAPLAGEPKRGPALRPAFLMRFLLVGFGLLSARLQ